MNFLNELYTVFDDLVDEFDLYKLDTVGDCYIIVAGMTSQDDDGFMCVGQPGASGGRETLAANAQSMMECAKAMLRESTAVRRRACDARGGGGREGGRTKCKRTAFSRSVPLCRLGPPGLQHKLWLCTVMRSAH